HKLMQHREAERPSVRAVRPDVPEELDEVVRRMMAVEPEARFQIPLLLVAPLRKFCPLSSVVGRSSNGGYRPGSAPALLSPSASNLPRPNGSGSLPRPPSSTNLPRPASTLNLPRPPTSGPGLR